jgi:tRNA pseudouridine13 synthase
LQKNPFDFGGALLSLDRRLRAMVVFEFQSYLWNEAVRRYLQSKVPDRDLLLLRYQIGTILFPRALPLDLAKAFRVKQFPLIASDSTFDDPEVRAANEAALVREKLTLQRLRVEKVNAFHFKHEDRPLFIYPGKLRASQPAPDEANRGRYKVVLSFTLPPGAYATLVVRRLMWFATPEHKEEAEKRKLAKPKPAPAPVEAAPVKTRKGFREKQKEKKVAKAKARSAATKSSRS